MACQEQLFLLEEFELLQHLLIWPQQLWSLVWLQPFPLPFLISQLQVLLLLPPLPFIEPCLLIWPRPSHSSSLLLLMALRLLLFEEQLFLKPYLWEKIWLAYHSSFQVLPWLIFHFFKPSCQFSLQLPTQVKIQPSHSYHLLLRFSSHSLAQVLFWRIYPSYRLPFPPSFRLLQPSLLILLTFYLQLAQLQPCHYLHFSGFLSQVRPPPSFHLTFPKLSP